MESARPTNPLADVFVRYLLGSEPIKDLLIEFVNPVFAHKGHRLVVDIEIRNPFNLPDMMESKESILDVRARDCGGRWINVEIQVSHERDYAARSLYYWARSYADQLGHAEPYGSLTPCVCNTLLDFTLFPALPEFHSFFQVTERDRSEFILTDQFAMHFVELSKLDAGLLDPGDAKLLAWCYFSWPKDG